MPSSAAGRGTRNAVAAAALFGLSAPLAKILLRDVAPLALSATLYLGAGVGLSLLRWLRPATRAHETPLRRADLGLLAGIVVMGGVVGPFLLLEGLARVSAVAGSLLLNLETPLTILLAVAIFGEHLGWREAGACALVAGGAAVLGWAPSGGERIELLGVVAVSGACLAWAIDNNLTQRLSLRDPVELVRTKALAAGVCSGVLAWAFGQPLPGAAVVAAGLVLGFSSYGVSLVLAVRAMRSLGAARQAAFFATAPFFGALAAVPLTGATLGRRDVLAMAIMALGVTQLVRERHDHEHAHDPLEHEHLHTHDAHHQHEHLPTDPPGPTHSHPHRHAPLLHRHEHASDLHHRH